MLNSLKAFVRNIYIYIYIYIIEGSSTRNEVKLLYNSIIIELLAKRIFTIAYIILINLTTVWLSIKLFAIFSSAMHPTSDKLRHTYKS